MEIFKACLLETKTVGIMGPNMLKQAFAVSDACAASEKDGNRSNKNEREIRPACIAAGPGQGIEE